MRKKKNKIASEAEFRQAILATARRFGFEGDVKLIFQRYDNLLRNCTNEQERKAISVMGATEIHRLMDCRGSLVIDGVEVVPAEPDFKDPDAIDYSACNKIVSG